MPKIKIISTPFKLGGKSVNLPGMKKGGKNKFQYCQVGGKPTPAEVKDKIAKVLNIAEPVAESEEALSKQYDALIQQMYRINTEIRDADNRMKNHKPSRIEKAGYALDAATKVYKPLEYPFGGNTSTPIEAEGGEVYMTPDSRLKKIPDSENAHEDGGVIINDADRVLEDTSTYRKDLDSKTLKLSPEQATALTGVKFKKPVSHSQAMEDADKHYNKFRFKLNKAIEKNVKTLETDKLEKYATNSLHLNMAHLNKLPTSGDIFDQLFEHQELIKNIAGIDQVKAMFGGKYSVPKAQVGIDNAERITDTKGWTFLYTKSGRNYYKKGDGTITSTQGPRATNEEWKKIFAGLSPERKDEIRRQAQGERFRYGFTREGLPVHDPVDLNLETGSLPAAPDKPSGQFTLRQGTNTETRTRNDFNEPLNWYDIAGPAGAYLSATDRIPNKLNPVDVNRIRLQLQNPEPALQAGTADYNAALRKVNTTGAGNSNISNIFTSKYNIDNNILGQYENINKGIKNQETIYNANAGDRQEVADQQAREVFEQKFLGSLEAQRQQKLQSLDELYNRFALNSKLNREGNLLMKLFPAFDQYGERTDYKYKFRAPLNFPKEALPDTKTKSTK